MKSARTHLNWHDRIKQRVMGLEAALQNILNAIDTGAIKVTTDQDETWENALRQARGAIGKSASQPTEREKVYKTGKRNGWLDALAGQCLTISLTSSVPGYSSGYRDGQSAYKEGVLLENI